MCYEIAAWKKADRKYAEHLRPIGMGKSHNIQHLLTIYTQESQTRWQDCKSGTVRHHNEGHRTVSVPTTNTPQTGLMFELLSFSAA